MTPADAYPAGLDPAHILAICTRAAGSEAGVQAVRTPDGSGSISRTGGPPGKPPARSGALGTPRRWSARAILAGTCW